MIVQIETMGYVFLCTLIIKVFTQWFVEKRREKGVRGGEWKKKNKVSKIMGIFKQRGLEFGNGVAGEWGKSQFYMWMGQSEFLVGSTVRYKHFVFSCEKGFHVFYSIIA